MKKSNDFPFERARRVTEKETRLFKKGIEEKLGVKRPSRGRPRKTADKYKAIAIRLHPKILEWAKREGKRRGVGYQTVINEVLLKVAA
jgi:uncharacterized protein (DUF4415 family)